MEVVTARGVQVPALGFGTWQLKGTECIEGVRHALGLGYRHLDTAQMYGNEYEVGQGIARSGVDRDEIFLTTKLGLDVLDPDKVVASTTDSLRALATDRVDLLLIHWPSDSVPLGATLEAMRGLQDDDKVVHLGVSNFPPSLLRAATKEAEILGVQVEYHPLLDQSALLEVCSEEDLVLTAYSPLAQGRALDEEAITDIAAAHGKSGAQVVLRWLVQQERVAAIPKSASSRRRRENVDIFDFSLTAGEMDRIAGVARGERLIDPPFAPDWETPERQR